MNKEKLQLLQDILGKSFSSGKEYLFLCPIVSCNSREKGKKKLSINLEKGKCGCFKCWVCGYSGNSIFHLIKRYGNSEQILQWGKLTGEINLAEKEDLKSLILDPKEREKEEILFSLPEEFISLVGNFDTITQRPRRYLLERGVEEDDIVKWRMGFCLNGNYENRIIIPSFNREGKVNYFVARTFVDDYVPYRNPPNTKDVIFNFLFLDMRKPLVIVEGIFDAIKVGGNVIPILGSSLPEHSKLFQEIITNNTIIFLGLDPDAKRKEISIIKKLLLYNIEVYKIPVLPFKDIGEMNKQEFCKRKKESIFIDNNRFLLYNILDGIK